MIVEGAIKKNIGARGLVTTINNIFMEIFYEVGNNPKKYCGVTIGKNILNDSSDYELIKRNSRKRARIVNDNNR